MSAQMPALDRAITANKVEEAERLWGQLSEKDREDIRVSISDNLARQGGRMTVPMASWLVKQGVEADSMVLIPGEGYKAWLSQAIKAKNAALVQWLVKEQGVDPNRPLPSAGPLPLVEALRDERWDMGELLLDLGAQLEAVNWHGQTALHWAAGGYMVQAMVWLITHGADPKATDTANHVPAELIPQDPGRNWRPDPTYDWLTACEGASLEDRQRIPPVIQEEALIEKIGLQFQGKKPEEWTDEDRAVEKALIERGVIEPPKDTSIQMRSRRTP